jgi:predicted transcriptional regulator
MRKLDQSVLENINREIRQIGYKYMNNLLDWNHVTMILEKEILPNIYEAIENEFEALNRNQLTLQAKINELSFKNDPQRDKKMIELFKAGHSRAMIAKEVGMSKWGVSKALRRLGVN